MHALVLYTEHLQNITDQCSQGESHDLQQSVDAVHEGQFGWPLSGLFEVCFRVTCVPVLVIALDKWVGIETVREYHEQQYLEDTASVLLFVL